LKRISKLFDAELSREEKLALVGNRRPMRKKDLKNQESQIFK